MEVSTEAWRVKHPRNWLSGKQARGDETVSKEEDQKKKPKDILKDGKRKKDFTLCFYSKKKKFIPAAREPSVLSLAASFNASCCRCCTLLSHYVREVLRCVYCLVNCRIPCMQFEELFGELLDATCAMCADMFHFVRAFLKSCVGSKD